MESTESALYLSWGPTILWGFVWYVMPAAVAAFFVFKDASKRKVLVLNIPPYAWALLCIPSGIFGLLAYWFMHHSSLAKTKPADDTL